MEANTSTPKMSSPICMKNTSPISIQTVELCCRICAYNNFCNLPTDPPDGLISQGAMYVNGTAPTASVEKAVIQFFDVQNDYLKTAPEYDAASDTYLQPFGYGGSGMLSLTSAKKKAIPLFYPLALKVLLTHITLRTNWKSSWEMRIPSSISVIPYRIEGDIFLLVWEGMKQ